MGRDKACLPFQGGRLAEFVARTVEAAAGSVALIGDPALYGEFGYPVVADLYPGEGPLGGILTALHHTSADWNLVVACDMPGLSASFLTRVLDAAEERGVPALLPAGPSGLPEPLCAVYHRRGRADIEAAFLRGERKVTAAVAGVGVAILEVAEVAAFQNVNTPEEWAGYVPK